MTEQHDGESHEIFETFCDRLQTDGDFRVSAELTARFLFEPAFRTWFQTVIYSELIEEPYPREEIIAEFERFREETPILHVFAGIHLYPQILDAIAPLFLSDMTLIRARVGGRSHLYALVEEEMEEWSFMWTELDDRFDLSPVAPRMTRTGAIEEPTSWPVVVGFISSDTPASTPPPADRSTTSSRSAKPSWQPSRLLVLPVASGRSSFEGRFEA